MAKISYTATDANGAIHTRKSERGYSHTVVYRNVKSEVMAQMQDAGWVKTDRSNYDYSVKLATGNHTWTCVTEKEIAKAKAIVENFTKEEYVADELAKRIASAENYDYTTWFNAGWCGRLDLAQKLAAKYSDCAILPAVAR